jgi:hypothetical protein
VTRPTASGRSCGAHAGEGRGSFRLSHNKQQCAVHHGAQQFLKHIQTDSYAQALSTGMLVRTQTLTHIRVRTHRHTDTLTRTCTPTRTHKYTCTYLQVGATAPGIIVNHERLRLWQRRLVPREPPSRRVGHQPAAVAIVKVCDASEAGPHEAIVLQELEQVLHYLPVLGDTSAPATTACSTSESAGQGQRGPVQQSSSGKLRSGNKRSQAKHRSKRGVMRAY